MNTTLTRRRRTKILIEGDPELRRSFSSEIERLYTIEEPNAPARSLVMLKLREGGRQGLFYAGEYLVSEARAIVAGTIGIGILAGEDGKGARELAIVDAAFKANLPEASAWMDRLLAEEARIASREDKEARRIAATRVNFESMQEERPIWAST
jgi:alpha-D-ribose 1-methylphosphonate 5-triphosphate synthase subunit PhnG